MVSGFASFLQWGRDQSIADVLALFLMIINHLYFISIAVSPFKANAILIVDAYAMLASPITRKLLQPIKGRRYSLPG